MPFFFFHASFLLFVYKNGIPRFYAQKHALRRKGNSCPSAYLACIDAQGKEEPLQRQIA
jgi:hypothetical protein